MTTLRTAAQQALEALEYHVEQTRPIDKTGEAITALRAALEQPEQKAECDGGTCGLGGYCDECPKRQPEQEPVAWLNSRPLYYDPPRREWRSLSEEEKRECAQAMDAEPLAEGWPELVKFARAIEQALKEKNT